MRRVSSTIRSVISQSSADRFIDKSCAAPEMPANGFLISCANISAMPIADFAAVEALRVRPIRSAITRGEMSSKIRSGSSCSGAICSRQCGRVRSWVVRVTSLILTSDWLARARAKDSPSGTSAFNLSVSTWCNRLLEDAFKNVSAAGFAATMVLAASISKAGMGRDAQMALNGAKGFMPPAFRRW